MIMQCLWDHRHHEAIYHNVQMIVHHPNKVTDLVITNMIKKLLLNTPKTFVQCFYEYIEYLWTLWMTLKWNKHKTGFANVIYLTTTNTVLH